MRAVLDPNVIISAVLAPGGAPARVLRAGLEGAYDLIASPLLLAELERALAYPKLRRRIPAGDAAALVDLVQSNARMVDDPLGPPVVRSLDPDDDYLIALAAEARAVLVSGDRHLLQLDRRLLIHAPGKFLDLLADRP